MSDSEVETICDTEQCNDVEEANNNDNAVESFEAKLVIKGRSTVWKHFIFKGSKVKGPNKKKVFCKLCERTAKKGNMMGIMYTGGTTNLINHLKIWHKSEYKKTIEEEDKKKESKNITDFFGEKAKNVTKWSKGSASWKNVTMTIAKWFCKSSRPAKMVEDKGFRVLMSLVCPQYEVPGRDTIGRYIAQLYEGEKKRISENLEEIQYCAITTDGGTSSNAVSFQDTNVQYIDNDLHMKTHTLAVQENKEEHTADNYRENTDEVLEEFDISAKVVMFVTDNEAKMKKAFNKEERSGCLAHIIHSSISKGIKETPEVDDILKKVRRIAQKYNKSYAFKYGVQVQQEKRGIPVRPILQDVPTRWGSSRASTESFLDSKKESDEDDEENPDEVGSDSDLFGDNFENMEAINDALRKIKYKKPQKLSDYLLFRSDMQRIKRIHQFLTKLDIFSTTLGGQNFVTGSIVFPVVASLKKLLKIDSEDAMYIAHMKEVVLDDFKQRIADNLNGDVLLKCTALDPRFKSMKIVENKEAREAIFKKLEKDLKEIASDTEEAVSVEDKIPKKKRKLGLDFDESDDESVEEEDPIKKEMKAYKLEPTLDKDSDPLDWWRARKNKYPYMIQLVKKYLCIPATSTQAERVFSALGFLLNKRRLCLSGDNVKAQLFLHDNLEL